MPPRTPAQLAPVALAAALPLLVLICAAAPSRAQEEQKTVHLIFSSHLDVGFTDLDSAVIELHWYTHFPRAAQLGRWFERHGAGDRFRYLTHSWLLALFFDCPPHIGLTCPVEQEKRELEDAIRSGAITWHAAPFNPNYEVFDSDTLAYAFNLTHTLDRRFGLRPKAVASLRDVPGLTRGAIPIMAASGVRMLTGGANGFSAPPGVPKRTPFVWRDEGSRQEILAMWHEGGYGGWHDNLHADNADDCIKAEGFSHVLCVSWRDDNGGPPASPQEALQVFAAVRAAWPGAAVAASTLEDYGAALLAAAPGLNLPVVTGEIGDTWVHGSASDPLRMADYRAALRARARCTRDPACDSQSPAFDRFSRLLIKVAEHTWGLAFNQEIGDVSNYTNAYLHPRLANASALPRYSRVIQSWQRQRDYVTWALQELPPDHPIRSDCEADSLDRRRHAAYGLPAGAARGGASGAGGGAPGAAVGAAAAGRGGAAAGAGAAAPAGAGVGDGPLVFRSHGWTLELDPYHGGLAHLARVYRRPDGQLRRVGNDWAGDGAAAVNTAAKSPHTPGAGRRRGRERTAAAAAVRPRFLQLRYNVYNESDFQPIWDDYAFTHPVWTGDFGKYNLSASSSLQQEAVPFISDLVASESPQDGVTWRVKYEFPRALVADAGAPGAMWLVLQSPPDSGALLVTVVWQNKTATRLPEATWVRFAPGAGAVDPAGWRLHKLGGAIDPSEILVNGSHSVHGVSEAGVTVASADGREELRIRPHDAPLLALGEPRPFPNPNRGPDMALGVSACLHNNVWGTNYPMWVPFTANDVSLAFRFTIEARELAAPPAVAAS